MYKTKTLLLACSLLPFLASCVSDPETHQLVPVEQPIILYADQTVDSLSFYTFDSWTVTPQADWITIDGPSHQDITYDYTKCYLCKAYLKVQPNTTGKTRTGMVLVQSYEYSYTSPFVQLGLLNVSHPLPTVDTWLNEQSSIPDVAHYELVDSAHWMSDSICFTVHSNWSLAFAEDPTPDWLVIDDAPVISNGHCRVGLTLTENTDTENERKATLRLTSGKVSNLITVRQLPVPKEE